MEEKVSGKNCNLLQYGNNYGRKKLYSTSLSVRLESLVYVGPFTVLNCAAIVLKMLVTDEHSSFLPIRRKNFLEFVP